MGRTPCCNADGLKKGAWTADEDQKLIAYIQGHGEGGWRTLPQKAGLQRCGKSCRLRWANYLRPDIKRGEFSTEEEQKIIQLHASLGNRWSAIARHLPKRTDNEIKNYWNTHLKKRLAEMGIDPVTHKPFGPSSPTTDNNSNPTHTSPHSQLTQPTTQTQLLNKLAAKLAPSRCLEALKTSQSPSLQSLSTEAGKNVLPKRPISSTSARLLNKMASRLTTPLHCLNTLKSILSSSLDYQSEGHNAIEAPHHDDFMHRSTSDSSLSETGSDMSRSNAITTPDLSPLMESFNLDLLKDWNGVDDGGVSSINMVDTYSSCWESPFSSFSNKKTFSGSESMHEVLDALTYNDSDKTYGSAQNDNYFMDGFSNFSINGCSEGSHEGRVFEGATYSWHNDHFFENNYQLPDSNVV